MIAPIYQGGALKTQVEIRTLEQKEAVAQYARLALRALGDVENALAAGQTLAERETMLRQILTDNQRALELSRTSYRVGSDDLRAVQQQQLNVHSARLALLRVQSEQLAQRANLHLALGGSFEAAASGRRPAAETGQTLDAAPAAEGDPPQSAAVAAGLRAGGLRRRRSSRPTRTRCSSCCPSWPSCRWRRS